MKCDGHPDPALTATVSGLIEKDRDREGLVVYDLTRTAGEAVGSYPITPSGKDLQDNYTVAAWIPGTLKITWGYPTGPHEERIPVDPDWIIEKFGKGTTNDYETASNKVFEVGENGITNWVNYLLGLDPTNVESVIHLDITPDLICVSNPTFIVRGIDNRLETPIGTVTNIAFELLECDTATGVYRRVSKDNEGRFPQKEVPIKYYRAGTIFDFKKE